MMDDTANNQAQQIQNAQMQNGQLTSADPISVGTGSPETPSVETNPAGQFNQAESQQNGESGYEKIKQLEKAVEGQIEKQKEKGESARRVEGHGKPSKEDKEREHKEVPVTVRPKFFGYRPSKKIANDPQYIKSNAGKGDKQDSKTWLLVFLDRVLKKESM